MATVTPGNRLYLYLLLRREIGVGQQVALSRLGEVLAADDIEPADLGCADVREVAEALPELLRVTTFRRGRLFVTPLENEELDAVIDRAARAREGKGSAPGGARGGKRSWRHGRGTKDPVATKPHREGAPASTGPRPALDVRPEDQKAEAAEQGTAHGAEAPDDEALAPAPVPTPEAPAPGGGTEAPRDDMPDAPDEVADMADSAPAASEATPGEQAGPAGTAGATGTGAEDAPEEAGPAGTPETVAAPAPDAAEPAAHEPEAPDQGAPATPVAPTAPSIHFTITYVPEEDEGHSEEGGAEVVSPATDDAPQAPRPRPATPAAGSLPRRPSTDVHVRDDELAELWRLLPLGADVAASVDEDWLVAEALGLAQARGSRVSFPLRRLRPDGTPVRVSLRRAPQSHGVRRWEVEVVDAGDVDDAGPEGLPIARGAWASLAPRAADDSHDPLLAFAGLVETGGAAFFERLASLAAPEPWGVPARPQGHAALGEYLAVTLARLRAEGKVVRDAEGQRAGLDTGLTTPAGEPIYLLLEATGSDVPWKASAGVGTQAVSGLPETPRPARYVRSLDDLAPDATLPVRGVDEDTDAACDAARAALVAARASWRVATPAWDVMSDETLLLVPLRDASAPDATARRVAALARRADTYELRAVLEPWQARVCARVVSAELPSWLA